MDGKPHFRAPDLIPRPLAVGERAGLAALLAKEHLPVGDIDAPGCLFWRFDTKDDMPLGFGGLEVHGRDALLRSVVTLPPARGHGVGRAIVTALETEATVAGCHAIYLLAAPSGLFAPLGYVACDAKGVPPSIRRSAQFSDFLAGRAPPAVGVMVKRLAPRPWR